MERHIDEESGILRPYKPKPDANFFEEFSFRSFTFKITMVEVVIFVLTLFHLIMLQIMYVTEGMSDEEKEQYGWECVLYSWGAKHAPSIVYRFHFHRLLLPALLHGSPMHILGNMVVQVYYGFILEVSHGWKRVIVVYILGALGASLFSCLRFPCLSQQIAVGASGAIFALLALELTFFMSHFPSIEKKRVVVFCLMAPITFLSFIESDPQVDVAGHLGGLVIGFFMGCAFACEDSRTMNGSIKIVGSYFFYGLTGFILMACLLILFMMGIEDEKICQ